MNRNITGNFERDRRWRALGERGEETTKSLSQTEVRSEVVVCFSGINIDRPRNELARKSEQHHVCDRVTRFVLSLPSASAKVRCDNDLR